MNVYSWISGKGASLIAQFVKNLPAMQEIRVGLNSWVGKIHCRRDRLPTPVFLGFTCSSAGKEFACNVGDQGDLGSIPGLEYPLEKGKDTHSNILAQRIPWTIQSMGSQKVRYD